MHARKDAKVGCDLLGNISPVVNWMSVRLILTLAIIHDLPAQAIYFVLAFPQAKLNILVFMELPVGCNPDSGQRDDYLIELKKSLYRLKQASLNWFKMLKEGLEDQGYVSSDVDPCVFLSKNTIVLTYIDNCLILAKSKHVIDKLIESLNSGKEKFDMAI